VAILFPSPFTYTPFSFHIIRLLLPEFVAVIPSLLAASAVPVVRDLKGIITITIMCPLRSKMIHIRLTFFEQFRIPHPVACIGVNFGADIFMLSTAMSGTLPYFAAGAPTGLHDVRREYGPTTWER